MNLFKSSSDEDEEDDDEAMDEEGKNESESKPRDSVLNKEDEENFEKMEEGWTFVTKTGKHLTK